MELKFKTCYDMNINMHTLMPSDGKVSTMPKKARKTINVNTALLFIVVYEVTTSFITMEWHDVIQSTRIILQPECKMRFSNTGENGRQTSLICKKNLLYIFNQSCENSAYAMFLFERWRTHLHRTDPFSYELQDFKILLN